jgi:enoyl-CoA hydratase/carnithine racemase
LGAAATYLARAIGAKGHLILVAVKRAMNMTNETNLATGLKYDVQTRATLNGACDQREGMCAF